MIGNVPKKKRQETIVWCYSLVSSNIAGCKNEGSPTAHRAFLLRNVYMECVCVCDPRNAGNDGSGRNARDDITSIVRSIGLRRLKIVWK